MYDSGYNEDADLMAQKVLYIIFIILILLANGLLISKNVRKCDFMYKPKTLTILSLAIGDVLMALFPMVVFTRLYFGDLRSISCSLSSTYSVYWQYLITFVYGLGLMVLGLEIVQHHKISSLSKNYKIVCSLIASSIPWILGLIIILPLGLANTCDGIQTIHQYKALSILGIILPACGAVITSIVVKYKYHTRCKPIVSSHPQVMINLKTHNTAYDTHNGNQHGHSFIVPTPLVTMETAVDDPIDSFQRRNRLFVISIIYFILVTPFAIFMLGYVLNPKRKQMGEVATVTVIRLVFWLNHIRSFITPLLMYGYSDK